MKRLVFVIILGLLFLISYNIYSSWTQKLPVNFADDFQWTTDIIKYDSCQFMSNSGTRSTFSVTSDLYYRVDQDNDDPTKWTPGRILTAVNIFILNPRIISILDAPATAPSATVKYKISSRKEDISGFFAIYKSTPEDSVVVDMYLGNRCLFHPRLGLELKGQDFQYDDRVFRECFVMDSTNSYIRIDGGPRPVREIRKVVFSKEYGLIYYSFSDGEEFFRIFK